MPATTSNRKSKATKAKSKAKATSEPGAESQDLQATETLNRPFKDFHPSDLNPRKKYDPVALAELAASIYHNGVLQSVVARETPDGLEIAAGSRRYLAVAKLVEEGRVTENFPIPVQVRVLSDLELLGIATAENVARQDMHPLEEADAFARLVEMGADAASVAAQYGYTLQTVQQRLKLSQGLSEVVKTAFWQDELTLGQVQQLSAASPTLQDHLLERIRESKDDRWGESWTPEDIRGFLADQLIPVSSALFDLNEYKGEITNDLFGDSEPCFCDTEQARTLQMKAYEALKTKLEQRWAWVDTVKPYQYPSYRYETPEEGETPDPTTCGAIITVDEHTWEVKSFEGVKRVGERTRVGERSGSESLSPNPSKKEERVKQPKDHFTGKHLEEAHRLKTLALQDKLVESYRTCLILNIMGMLGVKSVAVSADRDDLSQKIAGESAGLAAVFAEHHELAAFSSYPKETYPLQVSIYDPERELELYNHLKALDDAALSDLFSALTAYSYGTWPTRETGDSPLAVQVARDVGVDMLDAFELDAEFLGMYRKAQLPAIAKEVGIPYSIEGMKTDAMRTVILDHASRRKYVPGLAQFFARGETPPEGIAELLGPVAKAA